MRCVASVAEFRRSCCCAKRTARRYLLPVSREGKPVNKEVLEFVAEPVQVSGKLERDGELLVLRIDPGTIQRVR